MVLDFSYYETGLPGSFVEGRGCCDFLHSYFVHFLSPLSYLRFLCSRPASGKRLLSLPGGGNFDLLADKLGPELRTVWLGHGANCHETDEDHPFSCGACPKSHDKDCWQCLYMLQVELTIKQGEIPVAATTNLFEEDGECVGAETGGSSEVAGECFQQGPPEGWGVGCYPEDFCGVAGAGRAAPVHPQTGKPLGVGCRWERRYLDSLPQTVYVVATPPAPDSLESSAHAIMVLLQHGLFVLLILASLLGFVVFLLAVLEVILLLLVAWFALGCRKAMRLVAVCLGTIAFVNVCLAVGLRLFKFAGGFDLGPPSDTLFNSIYWLYAVSVLRVPSLAWHVRKARLGWTAAVEGEGCELVWAIVAIAFCLAWWWGVENGEGFLWGGVAALVGMYVLAMTVVHLEVAMTFERLGVLGGLRSIAQETYLCCCCGSCGHCVAPPRQMEPMRRDAKYLSRGCRGQEREALLGSFPAGCCASESTESSTESFGSVDGDGRDAAYACIPQQAHHGYEQQGYPGCGHPGYGLGYGQQGHPGYEQQGHPGYWHPGYGPQGQPGYEQQGNPGYRQQGHPGHGSRF